MPRMLTEHFGFEEVTQTSNAKLQDINRDKADTFISSLTAGCMMLELIREKVGPLRIHSGFRCSELNGATPGSSTKSQHMLGEAFDFSAAKSEPTPENVDGLFEAVLTALIEQAIPFGQLIRETAERDYGSADWVHISLGAPFREVAKCGQVLRMLNGSYTLVKTIPFNR